MGQQEILEILRKNKNRWVCGRDLAEITGVTISSTLRSLSKLRKSGMVDFEYGPRKDGSPRHIICKYKWKP